MPFPSRLISAANSRFTVKLFEYSDYGAIGNSLVHLAGAPPETPFQPTRAGMIR